ncbi:FtsX domain-containing protein [Strigomonas culicis]|uniref:FtsX domain-containing protein n=1 Tax=Strigomonas culicis TaxID=28005 RepID=S9TMC8_9TRYP|nr:FtsX domain-containing protein [Strigomonas culicis]|eukprot:EPY19397.1 FtsX domain-containing protein [Strigomonas culicis]
MTVDALRSTQCRNASQSSYLWYKQPYYSQDSRDEYMCYEHGCINSWCGRRYGSKFRLIGMNLTLEDKMEWAPDSSLIDLPPKGQITLSTEIASLLEVSVGDRLFLQTNAEDSLMEATKRLKRTEQQELLQPSVNTIIMVTVFSIIERSAERFPESSSFGLVNIDDVIDLAADGLSPVYTSTQVSAFRSVKSTECTSAIYFRLPKKDRKAAYVRSSYEPIRASVAAWGTVITESVGTFQLTATMPIVSYLKNMDYMMSFIGLTAKLVVVAFALLSILLIYSLLTVGIETRSYDLGIQRMIGLNRSDLVLTVLANAYFFATPAWATGLILGQLLFWIVRIVLVVIYDISLNKFISGSSVVWGTMAGLVIPLVASIVPIAHLISKSLPDALNTMRNNKGVLYKIKRRSSESFDFTSFFFGLLLFGFGYSVYNILPSSLLKMNLMTIFLIFFGLLMGILAGLVLLALNFESLIETCVIHVFLFWEDTSVFSLVKKSLISHRLENRKTTLMYALSMAFIIYITVSFSISSDSIIYSYERNYGSDILFSLPSPGTPKLHRGNTVDDNLDDSPTLSTPTHTVDVLNIKYYMDLDKLAKLNDHMASYYDNGTLTNVAYICASLTNGHFYPHVVSSTLYTIGRFQSSGSSVRVVSPTFYETVHSKFIIVSKTSDTVAQYGLSGALYSKSGEDGLIMATTTYRTFALSSLNDTAVIDYRGYRQLDAYSHTWNALHPVAVMDSSPFFLMTKSSNSMGELVGSVKTAMRLSGVPYASALRMPISHLFIAVSDDAYYEQVSNKVKKFLSDNSVSCTVQRADQRVKKFKKLSVC